MKRLTPPRYLIYFVALLSFSLGILTFHQKSLGQTNCNQAALPTATTWPQNATVQVNLSPSFTTEQRVAIQQSYINWQNSPGNQSGVHFVFTPTPGALPHDVNRIQPGSGQAETGGQTSSLTGHRISAFTNIDPRVTDITALTQVMAHETGHTFGLDDCQSCAAGSSVMTLPPQGDYNNTSAGRTGPSPCDVQTANQAGQYQPPPPPPPPTECSTEQGNECGAIGQLVGLPPSCGCQEFHRADPILVDVLGDGFSLTNLSDGVNFDIDADGNTERMAWTAPGADDAFLTLDRNGNGNIDNALELFGDVTPQPPSNLPHGFIALAEYDKPEYGGNGDGLIKKSDAVFSSLRLWQDANHNGVSEPAELHSLKQLSLKSIDLDYHRSGRRDEFGNVFRFRGKVRDTHDAQLGRWAWDVFLVSGQ